MRAFLLTRTSFPIPGRVKEPAFLVSDPDSPDRAGPDACKAELAVAFPDGILPTHFDIFYGADRRTGPAGITVPGNAEDPVASRDPGTRPAVREGIHAAGRI